LLLKALLQVVNSLILLKESCVLLLGAFLHLELESVESGLVVLIGLTVLGDFGNGVMINSWLIDDSLSFCTCFIAFIVKALYIVKELISEVALVVVFCLLFGNRVIRWNSLEILEFPLQLFYFGSSSVKLLERWVKLLLLRSEVVLECLFYDEVLATKVGFQNPDTLFGHMSAALIPVDTFLCTPDVFGRSDIDIELLLRIAGNFVS
jgi:hypothetical protein